MNRYLLGTFVQTLGETLSRFASKNPNAFYRDFLQNTAIPNSQTFGQLVMWGEALVAVAIVIPALYLIFQPKTKCKVTLWLLIVGLIGGAFLNLNFWLASGYTSPSSDGLNLLMLVTQVVGVLCILDYNKKV
ncbi:MAG: hypothetical protein UV33_C0001G0024 [Candidatus Daviesbacteria bacterium GW2011_GWA1_42_6]|uniref:DoxX family protein n=1 Tax=Candidatus Daviesbacteria bacterium GW2011_GWA1_42_6 TaxID=1618420 RepID=A0A0G1D3S5_9BACT|nr:MAG: hypothetical protein UV33_C0001G0024 [Candidatus Daviesbacteria bacterium GW2011_GWA1_42_6]